MNSEKKKRKPGPQPSKLGPRKEIVKVSLRADELDTILRATNAPARYMREAALEKAQAARRDLDDYRYSDE